MTADGDENQRTNGDPGAPRLTHLERAHVKVTRCLADLESAGDADGILASLEALLAILPEHFAVDEEGPKGLFTELRARRPELEPQLKFLEREHRQILKILGELQSDVRETGDDFARTHERRAACVRKIRAHEETENEIVQEVFYLDEGGLG